MACLGPFVERGYIVKNVIILADGRQLSSGDSTQDAILSCTVTDQVNSGTELTPGSACCACLEASVFTPGGDLSIPTGEPVTLKKEDGTQVGVFMPERPVRSGPNSYKLTAYDRVSLLDKDLSQWLQGLSGWPYTLIGFAGMVCQACGLELATSEIPNGDMKVQEFSVAGVTGRQLLRWVGELACRFCRADADGKIRLEWYRQSDVVVTPGGERFYYSGALSYEDYEVAAVDAVKVRLADSDEGALWPEGAAQNAYVIAGNPMVQVDDGLEGRLEVIRQELAAMPAYRPCTVEIPAGEDIQAGDVVTVEGRDGVRFRSCVMSRTVKGQRQVLECTGSIDRSSTMAVNGRSPSQIAQEVVDRQSHAYIFNKLTDGGKIQGIYQQDGKWYINAQVAKIVDLTADQVTAGKLQSVDGKTYFDLDSGVICSVSDKSRAQVSGGDVRLYNSDGVLVADLVTESGNGCVRVYGADGVCQLALMATAAGPMVTCYDVALEKYVSSPVGFREVGGVKVLAVR